jgi:hypothetical protein
LIPVSAPIKERKPINLGEKMAKWVTPEFLMEVENNRRKKKLEEQKKKAQEVFELVQSDKGLKDLLGRIKKGYDDPEAIVNICMYAFFVFSSSF